MGVGGKGHSQEALLPGKRPCTLCAEWLGGPRGHSGQVRKISPPPEFDYRIIAGRASRRKRGLKFVIL
jgi:hypothetical protein